MPNCRDCGQEIQWIDGKPFDMTPASHWRNAVHIKATRGKHLPKRKSGPLVQTWPNIEFSKDISEDEQASLRAAIERAQEARK